jgi:hypothetical protein
MIRLTHYLDVDMLADNSAHVGARLQDWYGRIFLHKGARAETCV